jgi:hypothetical protein
MTLLARKLCAHLTLGGMHSVLLNEQNMKMGDRLK